MPNRAHHPALFVILFSCSLLLAFGIAAPARAGPTTPLESGRAGGGMSSVGAGELKSTSGPVTWVFATLPGTTWDDQNHRYIMLGEILNVQGNAAFCDANGDFIDPPACKVSLVVKLEKGAKWVKVKKAKVTLSPMGTYHWTYTPAKTGAYCVQASIAKGKGYASGHSLWCPFLVK